MPRRDATFLSTADGAETFSDAPILAGGSMTGLVCTAATTCIVTGTENGPTSHGLGPTPGSSVVAVTTNGGRTWAGGSLPAGSRVQSGMLTCSDSRHCAMVVTAATHKTTRVVTTDDAGLTWTEEPAPLNGTHIGITSLSRLTDSECWAAGDFQPKPQSGDVPLLLGTTNEGASWSKVTFSVPAGAPNFDNQSYISMGQITCATATVWWHGERSPPVRRVHRSTAFAHELRSASHCSGIGPRQDEATPGDHIQADEVDRPCQHTPCGGLTVV